MIIVGGTYAESVVVPSFANSQGGSGLRGALAIGDHCAKLVTALAEHEVIHDSVVRSRATIVGRAESVSFHYLSPVSTPTVLGRNTRVDAPLCADGDGVLVVGMVERADYSVRAKSLVIDPQSPGGIRSGAFDGLTGDREVLSLNAGEAASMLDHPEDPASNAEEILEKSDYFAVVVRAGARGSFVATARNTTPIPAHPTQTVWSLGSGDTYSAVLAHAWSSGHDVVEAAEIASNAAAWWCGQRDPAVPAEILEGSMTVEQYLGQSAPKLIQAHYSPRVYLGGPFFTVAEHMLLDTVLHTLTSLGAKPFSPFHHVGAGQDEVAQRDIDGLGECDAMLALLDHYDPGTVFEAGWAIARGIPVVGYRSRQSDEGDKMLVGLGAEVHSDLTSALYRTVWAAQGAPLTAGRHELVQPTI